MINLKHALIQLQTPNEQGEGKEFSLSFTPISGNRKGKVLHIRKAIMRKLSKEKAQEAIVNAHKPKKKYDPKSHNINIQVIESDDFPEGVITVKDWSILELNDLKTII
ncbi:hypothetical protein [Flammeovirga pacifica]|uniref:Uncharacterized protein n=1 Tax=Flammeovirga pacifica TaxID=915059 RepID=A0A1S1Z2P9_FLAPC|nr:hypothetical protein [Flammeovirga pacifica]OHX67375.1 hypothetical protein NH26_13990 [Flammeovirga pacifica]